MPDDIDVLAGARVILHAHIAATAKSKEGACGGGTSTIRVVRTRAQRSLFEEEAP